VIDLLERIIHFWCIRPMDKPALDFLFYWAGIWGILMMFCFFMAPVYLFLRDLFTITEPIIMLALIMGVISAGLAISKVWVDYHE
jgi:hypothetical protein